MNAPSHNSIKPLGSTPFMVQARSPHHNAAQVVVGASVPWTRYQLLAAAPERKGQ